MTTIEAMKQAMDWVSSRPDMREISAGKMESILFEAIAEEEAQGVEPCLRFIRSGEPGTSSETISVVAIAALPKDGALLFTRPSQPANTEFLTVKLELMTAERDKMQLELGDLRALRAARPAPPPAGERAALAGRLRGLADAARLRGPGCTPYMTCDDVDGIADVLAADAQEIERKYISPVRTVADLANNLLLIDQALPIYGAQYIDHPTRGRCAIAVSPTVSRERVQDSRWIGQGNELNAAIVWTRAAQQVAMPQEKDKLCEGLSTGQVMQKAFAWCPTDHPHKLRMQWIADYFIANAPQADALAADHVEDVRAMVPMTDQELDDLLPTNDSMSREDSQRWIARATERHHEIGVKP